MVPPPAALAALTAATRAFWFVHGTLTLVPAAAVAAGLRFVFLLITRIATWLRLSRREEAQKTAEFLVLRH